MYSAPRDVVAAVLLLPLLSLSTEAGVTFEHRAVTTEAEPGQPRVEASFPFTNDGESPLTIKSVLTGCGCTTAALEKRAYAPGEGGRIGVIFEIGDRTGEQVKHITVWTDDEADPVTTLTLKVHIAPLVKTTPEHLYWEAGEPREPKTLLLEVARQEPLELLEARPDHPRFTATLDPVEPGRRSNTIC